MVQASPVDFRRDIPPVENKILSGSSPRVFRHPEAAPEARLLYAPRTLGGCPLPAFPRGPFIVAGHASRGSRGRNSLRPGVGELRGAHGARHLAHAGLPAPRDAEGPEARARRSQRQNL